jgi:hypothetical protein
MLKYEECADRKTGGKYENKDPIVDQWEILDLLQKGENDSLQGRYIYTNTEVPEICVGWYSEGDSGGDTSGTYYFLIDPAVIKTLKEKGLVEPKRQPMIGHTIIHEHRLVLSKDGEREIQAHHDRQRTAAIKLRMKKKTCFTCTGSSRDNCQFGALFFEFRNNNTLNRSRVYPDSGKIVRVR